jgi:hypothetical protein
MSKGLLALIPVLLAAQDPRAIVAESQQRTQSKSQHYEGTLTVVDSKEEGPVRGGLTTGLALMARASPSSGSQRRQRCVASLCWW